MNVHKNVLRVFNVEVGFAKNPSLKKEISAISSTVVILIKIFTALIECVASQDKKGIFVH